MVQTPVQPIALSAFLEMPETKPASEYLNGKIIQKPMPQGEHSRIQAKLASAIEQALEPKKVALAFTELRCTFDGSSIVPDISVYVWNRIPRQENGRVANRFELSPDWIIEILSPDQSWSQVTKKILRCLNDETQMGWLIDPSSDSVAVYVKDGLPIVYDMAESPHDTKLLVPDFAQPFSLTIGELFGWLM